MSHIHLDPYLPSNTLEQVDNWTQDFNLTILLSKERKSKLGDYRRLRGDAHLITINHSLEPYLFFFVLTHELAHLHTFSIYGPRVAAHGKEWKHTFRIMLLETLDKYPESLQLPMQNFARLPKANFMASPDLVKHFEYNVLAPNEAYIEDLGFDTQFEYRGELFQTLSKLKKNYLCQHIATGKKYRFNCLARVKIRK